MDQGWSWQNDDDGMGIGGRPTSTPALRTGAAAGGGGGDGGPGGYQQQEIGGGGGGALTFVGVMVVRRRRWIEMVVPMVVGQEGREGLVVERRRRWRCSGGNGPGWERYGRSEWPGGSYGLGNEDKGSQKEVPETTAAEWQRPTAAIGRGPVAVAVHLPLTAGGDDDRRLPGHWWSHPNTFCFEGATGWILCLL